MFVVQMSLLVIVLSSYYQTASMGLVILLLTWSAIPDSFKVGGVYGIVEIDPLFDRI